MYAIGPLGNIEKHLENVETHIGLAWAKSISGSAPLRVMGPVLLYFDSAVELSNSFLNLQDLLQKP